MFVRLDINTYFFQKHSQRCLNLPLYQTSKYRDGSFFCVPCNETFALDKKFRHLSTKTHQRAEQAHNIRLSPRAYLTTLASLLDLRLPTTVHVPVRDEPSALGPVILSSTTVLLSDSIDNILQQLQKDLGPAFRVPVKGSG